MAGRMPLSTTPEPVPLPIQPTSQRDPAYGRLLRDAAAAGVRLLPVVCTLDDSSSAVRFRGTLPVDLDYKWEG